MWVNELLGDRVHKKIEYDFLQNDDDDGSKQKWRKLRELVCIGSATVAVYFGFGKVRIFAKSPP